MGASAMAWAASQKLAAASAASAASLRRRRPWQVVRTPMRGSPRDASPPSLESFEPVWTVASDAAGGRHGVAQEEASGAGGRRATDRGARPGRRHLGRHQEAQEAGYHTVEAVVVDEELSGIKGISEAKVEKHQEEFKMLDYMSFQTAAVQQRSGRTWHSRRARAARRAAERHAGRRRRQDRLDHRGLQEFRTGKTRLTCRPLPAAAAHPPARRRAPAAAPRAALQACPASLGLCVTCQLPLEQGGCEGKRCTSTPRALPERLVDRREVMGCGGSNARRERSRTPLTPRFPPLYLRYGLNSRDVLDNVSYARTTPTTSSSCSRSRRATWRRCVRWDASDAALYTRSTVLPPPAPPLRAASSSSTRRPAVPYRLLGARRARGAADAPRQVPARARPAGVAVRTASDQPRVRG